MELLHQQTRYIDVLSKFGRQQISWNSSSSPFNWHREPTGSWYQREALLTCCWGDTFQEVLGFDKDNPAFLPEVFGHIREAWGQNQHELGWILLPTMSADPSEPSWIAGGLGWCGKTFSTGEICLTAFAWTPGLLVVGKRGQRALGHLSLFSSEFSVGFFFNELAPLHCFKKTLTQVKLALWVKGCWESGGINEKMNTWVNKL